MTTMVLAFPAKAMKGYESEDGKYLMIDTNLSAEGFLLAVSKVVGMDLDTMVISPVGDAGCMVSGGLRRPKKEKKDEGDKDTDGGDGNAEKASSEATEGTEE